jgi:centrosomal protein CEP164
VLEYAKYIGMDLEKDKEFLYIAKLGLEAPLPPSWQACESEEGEIFYFNRATGVSTWSHPLDDHFKEQFKLDKAKKIEKVVYYNEQIK